MVLVTGGTGLVGSHLLLQLVEKGVSVCAIHRKESDLERVARVFSYYSAEATQLFSKVKWLRASLDDISRLEMAFEGITKVYHCAALISFDPNNFEALLKTNVEGTANIVNLCLSHHVEKLCYVSSIAAIGNTVDKKPITETADWNDTDANVYALSKHAAELEVWRGAEEGLAVAIVNPGIILGPGYWKTGSGTLFSIAAKHSRYYPPGGSGFIAVTDVAKILVELMNSTIHHERFILINKNLSYHEVLLKIKKELAIAPPKKALKFWQLQCLWRLDWLRNFLTGKNRLLTKNDVISLKHPQVYDNQKIIDHTEFIFEPIDHTIPFCCAIYAKESVNSQL